MYGKLVFLICAIFIRTIRILYITDVCSRKSIIIFSLPVYQSYVADFSQGKVKHNNGLEITDTPQGVPSLEEYLTDYCAAAVRPLLIMLITE